ncbi:MAG: HAMP domain-containing sensor histidine kinase [Vicinamibacterales bacterium]
MTDALASRLPIQWRLAAVAALTVGAALAVLSAAVYAALDSYAEQELDAELPVLAALHGAGQAVEGTGAPDGVFWLVLGPDGGVVRSSANAPPAAALPSGAVAEALRGHRTIESTDVDGRPVRVAVVPSEAVPGERAIAIGVGREAWRVTAARMRWFLLVVWLVGSLATFGLTRVFAQRLLAPLDSMAARVTAIARGTPAARLAEPAVDDEVGRMGKLLNDMLDRLQRAVDGHRRFAADASHELRSPLTAVVGEVKVALRKVRTVEEYQQVLLRVQEHLDQIAGLTDSLMLLATADEGGHPWLIREIPLKPMLDASLSRLEGLRQLNGIVVHVDPGIGRFGVYADEGLLARLFDNLLTNAIKYNRQGGSVWVRARLVDGGTDAQAVRIAVADTGLGIPRSEWARVFDRFYRVDSSRTRQTGGAGLGLAICQTVVASLGGVIRIAESSPEGTTLEVALKGYDAAEPVRADASLDVES